jgi:hypothetical protein
MSRVQPPEKHTSSTGRHRGLRGCAGFRSSAGRAQSGAGRRGARAEHPRACPSASPTRPHVHTRELRPERPRCAPARSRASTPPRSRPARGPSPTLRDPDAILDRIGTESVDLIYLDPPFNSNRAYNVIYSGGGEEDRAQIEAFDDRK